MTNLDTLIIIKLQFNDTNTTISYDITSFKQYIYKFKDIVCFGKKQKHFIVCTNETKPQKVVQTNEWIENYIKTGDEDYKHWQKSEEAKEEECFRLPVEFQSDKVA